MSVNLKAKMTGEGGRKRKRSVDDLREGEERTTKTTKLSPNHNRKSEKIVSDFDLMIERRKKERKRRQTKGDEMNRSEETVRKTIRSMMEAVEKDRELNRQGKPTIVVLQELDCCRNILKNAGMREAVIELGMFKALAEWLAPLPSGCLPQFNIRETILKHLNDFRYIDASSLKDSGLARALVYLLSHPRETVANKELCSRLVNCCLCPDTNHSTTFAELTKEEKHDIFHEPPQKMSKVDAERSFSDALSAPKRQELVERSMETSRARVPIPSRKDYVVRPKRAVVDKCETGKTEKKNKNEAILKRMRSNWKLHQAKFASRKSCPVSVNGKSIL